MTTSSEEWPCEFREAKPEDRPFWMDLWTKSYRRSRWAGCIPNNLFHDVMRTCIEGLERRGLKVLVAHVPDEPDSLMGFVAYERKEGDLGHVAFLGVKDPYRRGRVGTKLLERAVGRAFRYSFRTEHSRFFMGSGAPGPRKWEASYAPEIARRKEL